MVSEKLWCCFQMWLRTFERLLWKGGFCGFYRRRALFTLAFIECMTRLMRVLLLLKEKTGDHMVSSIFRIGLIAFPTELYHLPSSSEASTCTTHLGAKRFDSSSPGPKCLSHSICNSPEFCIWRQYLKWLGCCQPREQALGCWWDNGDTCCLSSSVWFYHLRGFVVLGLSLVPLIFVILTEHGQVIDPD